MVGLGALTADSIFLIITFFLGSLIIFNDALRSAFYMVSFVLMLLLAYLTFRSLKGLGRLTGNSERGGHLPYVTGLTIGLTNPLQITWWLSVGLSLISSIGLIIIMGFFTGILLWITIFPLTMHWASSRVPSLYRWVIYASTLLLFAFAGWFLYSFLAILL